MSSRTNATSIRSAPCVRSPPRSACRVHGVAPFSAEPLSFRGLGVLLSRSTSGCRFPPRSTRITLPSFHSSSSRSATGAIRLMSGAPSQLKPSTTNRLILILFLRRPLRRLILRILRHPHPRTTSSSVCHVECIGTSAAGLHWTQRCFPAVPPGKLPSTREYRGALSGLSRFPRSVNNGMWELALTAEVSLVQ